MAILNTSMNDMDISVSVIDQHMLERLQVSVGKLAQLFKTMSHPDRLVLLTQLTQGEFCVRELEELVGLGQPSLSQQLGILRKEDIVKTRREGKQIFYSLANDDVLAVLHLLSNRL